MASFSVINIYRDLYYRSIKKNDKTIFPKKEVFPGIVSY